MGSNWSQERLEPYQTARGGSHDEPQMLSKDHGASHTGHQTLEGKEKRPENNSEVGKSWGPTLFIEGCVVSTSSTKPGVNIV